MTDDEKKAAILGLIEQGITFADIIGVFAERNTDEAKRMIELARDQWYREGEIEIDDATITSGSDGDGDYVLAWVWVDDPTRETDMVEPDQPVFTEDGQETTVAALKPGQKIRWFDDDPLREVISADPTKKGDYVVLKTRGPSREEEPQTEGSPS